MEGLALRILLLLLPLALPVSCGGGADPADYSLILVTLDTTRADRIGAFGGSAVPTPALDRHAREGVVFEDAVSQAPLTLPAHASILTGRYPASHGVRHNGLYRLSDDETTLAERLADAGFESAAFVAASVLNRGTGIEQGFLRFDDVSGLPRDLAERSADAVNAQVFDWLERRPPGRFFLWVHYFDPHAPYEPPETPGRPLHGTGYDREISYLDACYGELMQRLAGLGLLDRSLLVVAGDHGEALGEHQEQGHGIFLYRPTLHVPLFMRAPRILRPGSRVRGAVELVDIVPTVLDYLGLAPGDEVEGVSLRSRIDGASAVAPPVFAETFMPRLEFGWSELRMVQDGRYKYVDAPRPELYDLRSDPGETRNLAPNEPERAGELVTLLDEWVAGTSGDELAAPRRLEPEEEARLRSLGYLGGTAGADALAARHRADPKDRIREHVRLQDARSRLAAGAPAEALRGLDALIADSPDNLLAHNTRIRALVHLERLAEAERAARRALELAEAETGETAGVLQNRALRALAGIEWLLGKRDDALRRFEAAGPGGSGMDNVLLGTAANRADAEQLVALALRRDPDDPMALSAQRDDADTLGRLGAARLAAGDLTGAEEALLEARRLRPEDPQIYLFLGNVALAREDEATARGRFREALEHKPDWAAPRASLAVWLANRGRLDEAEALLVEARTLAPEEAEIVTLLDRVRDAKDAVAP